MDAPQARQLVLVSMLATGGVISYDLLKHKDSLGADQSFRAIWSTALLFLLLAILADTVPELAGPFALLVLMAVLIGRQGVLGSIVKVGAQPAPKTGGTK
jgi:hypothetical protein